MSKKINDGGLAFPMPETENYHPSFGMSLRDYFASKASDEDIQEIIKSLNYPVSRQEARYIHADRMIKAREK